MARPSPVSERVSPFSFEAGQRTFDPLEVSVNQRLMIVTIFGGLLIQAVLGQEWTPDRGQLVEQPKPYPA